MPQTYTVKPGETLWKIAQKYLGAGKRWKEIQGYTGKPEALPAGTLLTIPTESPIEKATEIRTQLRGGAGAPETPVTPTAPITETGLGKFTGGEYDISKIQTDLATSSAEKKKSYEEMVGLQASLYEEEYKNVGLGDVKTKIAGVDTDISNRKAQRDQMLLDEMGKPIPQWMITGRKKLEVEAATKDLNQLIDQRNLLASQYNTGIENVTRKVGYGLQDATAKYGYWEGEEKRLSDLAKTYQTTLASELERGEEAERWGKEFGLEEKLYELKKAKAGEPETRTKGLQIIKDFMGNPIGYFDPETGETTYYGEESGGAPGTPAGTEGIKWFTEADVRTVVNEALDENTPEAVKSSFANIRVSDSSKSLGDIVDEEQNRRTGGGKRGLGQWLKEEVWERMPFVK